MRNLRHSKEQEAATEKARKSADHDPHLEELLDQELGSLPDKYRTAVILCDLEGLTIADAAKQVGCPQGTLSVRLFRGRAMLAKRLTRRGLTLGVGAIAAALSQGPASAGVPLPLVISTVKAAGLLAAGQTVAGTIGAKVTVLIEGVLKTMLLTKLKNLAIVLVLATTLAGTGTMVAISRKAGAQADQKSPPAPEAKPQRDTSPPGQPGPLPDQAKKSETTPRPPRDPESDPLPEGAVARLGSIRFCHGNPVKSMTLSPDGKTLATVAPNRAVRVKVWNMADGKERLQLNDKRYQAALFLPDNKTLALATHGVGVILFDLEAGKQTQHFDASALAHIGHGFRRTQFNRSTCPVAGRQDPCHLDHRPPARRFCLKRS